MESRGGNFPVTDVGLAGRTVLFHAGANKQYNPLEELSLLFFYPHQSNPIRRAGKAEGEKLAVARFCT
jgi:hypothetical protein